MRRECIGLTIFGARLEDWAIDLSEGSGEVSLFEEIVPLFSLTLVQIERMDHTNAPDVVEVGFIAVSRQKRAVFCDSGTYSGVQLAERTRPTTHPERFVRGMGCATMYSENVATRHRRCTTIASSSRMDWTLMVSRTCSVKRLHSSRARATFSGSSELRMVGSFESSFSASSRSRGFFEASRKASKVRPPKSNVRVASASSPHVGTTPVVEFGSAQSTI